MSKNCTPLKPYTPETIRECYSVPIYQRLFEWSEENINILLSDLLRSYKQSKDSDYYIGMLTSTGKHELVDGQQRFVVMMLIGCALREYDGWKGFIQSGDKPRLYFTSRPNDNDYLRTLIAGSQVDACYDNAKMKRGIEEIQSFFRELGVEDRRGFSRYIFTHMNFFISELPEKYSPTDLNTYFERMNTTGKNLEQHEILKVKLLRHFGRESSKYMQLWNKLADVDTLLVRKREKKENEDDFQRRKTTAVQADLQTIMAGDIINGLHVNDLDETSRPIGQIDPLKTQPTSETYYVQDSRAPLRFPQFLLQTLYFTVTKKEGGIDERKEEFFNANNLLAMFEKYLPYEGEVSEEKIGDIRTFLQNLLTFRLILDICFVRLTEDGYYLDMNLPEEDESKKSLIMYESMLYVSSPTTTNHEWFGWIMDFIINVKERQIPTAKELCDYLKKKDDNAHGKCPPPYDQLSYYNINRYWFWRLDYYLWERREEIFKGESLNVANSYVFRRNRSIEHIVPQTHEQDVTLKWKDKREEEFDPNDEARVREMLENIPWADLNFSEEDEKIADRIIRHSFGNLAMISSSLNSSLQNSPYEEKRAHVASHCKGDYGGSIESLNLLWIYEIYESWTKDNFRKNIIEHGKEMLKLLDDSFGGEQKMQESISEIVGGSEL